MFEGDEVWIRAKAYRWNSEQMLVELRQKLPGKPAGPYTLNVPFEDVRTVDRVRNLIEVVMQLQDPDPDTGDRMVSLFALQEALDGE